MITAGTLLDASDGLTAVEDLSIGMEVQTLDHGSQPIAELRRRTAYGRRALTPVRIAAGAIGNERSLLVSPKTQLLVFDRSVKLGAPHAPFISAEALVNGGDVTLEPVDQVEYFLIIFSRSVVAAIDGVPAYFPNPLDANLANDG